MESSSITLKRVTLVLDDLESTWLKNLMQNSICENETETDKTMREIFWQALNKEGVGI